MKLINITITNSNAPRTLKYKVDLQNNSGTWNTIHYGKFFVPANATTVTLDLEDILVNYKFQGIDSIKPILDIDNNAYIMPAVGQQINSDYFFNIVRVTSLDNPVAFTQTSKQFYFNNYRVFGTEDYTLSDGLNIPVTEKLMPRLPNNPPKGFNWSVMIYNNTTRPAQVEYKRDNTVINTFYTTAKTPYHIPLSGASEAYFVNDRQVAQVDTCNKPYYLIWIENSGALQCQGFLATSEFGRKYDNKTRVDNKNVEWKVTATTTGDWKLKSSNLSNDEYRIYGELFNSPFLILLDIENGNLHYVNVSKSDYTEKRKNRTNTKPIYFEVELTSADHMRI